MSPLVVQLLSLLVIVAPFVEGAVRDDPHFIQLEKGVASMASSIELKLEGLGAAFFPA